MTHNKKSFFTLAEVLATLVILGVVAAITIPSTITRARHREFVTKAKKTYAALEQATEIWMVEEGCIGDINICIAQINNRRLNSPHGFDGIARNLNIVASTTYIQTLDKNKVDISEQALQQIDWLPDKATQYNGSAQVHSWEAVSKVGGGGTNQPVGLYLLKDGTTISLQFPDANRQSGFGFFDVNGKKGPNKVGVDVYPFGFGIPYRTPQQKQQNEEIFGSYAFGINPFYVEDNTGGAGLCIVRNGNESHCTNDMRNNPTAYLLKHNEIPNR